jgi:hypothetical protein
MNSHYDHMHGMIVEHLTTFFRDPEGVDPNDYYTAMYDSDVLADYDYTEWEINC